MLREVILLIVLFQGFLGMSQEVILEDKKEVDLVNEYEEFYTEIQLEFDDLNSEFEIIAEHAEGVNLFTTSLLKAAEDGEATVKIPEEIDAKESSIGIEDAIDKIEDICEINMKIAQHLLQKVEDGIALRQNITKVVKKLVELKEGIKVVMQVYTDVMRKISEQRQSLTINQYYEYLYVDEEDQILSARNPLPKSAVNSDDTDASEQQNFNIIPYGNDAHHEDDDEKSHDFTPKPSTHDQNVSPDPLIKRTPSVISKKTAGFPHIPTFTIVLIVLSLSLLTFIAITICVCMLKKRQQAKSSTTSLAEETKKEPISIVTLPVDCHKPTPNINTEKSDLPNYLDVICDKMQS